MAAEIRKKLQKVGWPEEIQQTLFRNLGGDANFKQRYSAAIKFFDKSLELKNDDTNSYYYRSKAKGALSQTENALEDAFKAFSLDTFHHLVCLQVCDCLHDVNNFEDAYVQLKNMSRNFVGNRQHDFTVRMDVIEKHFEDCLGTYLGPFFLKNRKHLQKIVDNYRAKDDGVPMYKRKLQANLCDVMSIDEAVEEVLHPREIERQKLWYRVCCRRYFRNIFIDLDFLKLLRTDKILLLPQTLHSTKQLMAIVKNSYDILIKFLKMLQARSPLYSELYKRFPNTKLAAKMKEKHLYRVQYQTRRDMFIILDKATCLREQGKLERLIEYVESIMGDYVVIKSRRVMPRRFEFVNEIYNILGLAYIDKLKVPRSLKNYDLGDRPLVLMNLPVDENTDEEFISQPQPKNAFPSFSNYQLRDEIDFSSIIWQKLINRLDRRLRFANYQIEKSYLLHEMARNHLNQSKFDECVNLAKRGLEEAKGCQNGIWSFLCQLMICKAQATQKKIERLQESLIEVLEIAEKLKSEKLVNVIKACIDSNNKLIEIKRRRSSIDLRRRSQVRVLE